MIERIEITNYKSFQRASLELGPLTLLVGANASGKSNALEGIRLLSWLASGRKLDDLMLDVQESSQLVRGAITSLPYPGESEFELGCRLSLKSWRNFSIRIRVTDDGMRIVGESVSSPDEQVPLYTVKEPAGMYTHDIQVQYNNFARGGKKPQIPCTDQQAIFTQLETPARFLGSHKKAQGVIPETVAQLKDMLENILFIDPSPRHMRSYSYKSEKTLKGSGSNLSSVLWHLCKSPEGKEAVLEFIRSLPEQDIVDIGFLETERNEVMLNLTESFGGRGQTWDAGHLSDGTLRVLAVAAALLSAPAGSLVIVEEIDNGVHPSRAGTILRNIQRTAKARGLRVLLTTHNPALLDALPDSAIPDVVYCYRDPETGASRLVRLQDLDHYPDLVARGPLGQLMTMGWMERSVKEAPDDRMKRGLAWLDRLKSDVSAYHLTS